MSTGGNWNQQSCVLKMWKPFFLGNVEISKKGLLALQMHCTACVSVRVTMRRGGLVGQNLNSFVFDRVQVWKLKKRSFFTWNWHLFYAIWPIEFGPLLSLKCIFKTVFNFVHQSLLTRLASYCCISIFQKKKSKKRNKNVCFHCSWCLFCGYLIEFLVVRRQRQLNKD